jgi:hypothetical protein
MLKSKEGHVISPCTTATQYLLVTLDSELHGQTAIKHDVREEFGRISAIAARAENSPQ